MAKEIEKVYSSWVVFTNERLTAMNIGNMAYKLGFNGSVRRESEVCADTPTNMYKVSMFGKVMPDAKTAMTKYISEQPGVCDFTIER